MNGLARSLKYAGFRAARVIGVCLLMAVGFIFYFAFLDGARFTLQNLLPRFPFMLLFIGNLMFMIYGMLDVATYTQLTLTYGCTRKNAMISTVFIHFVQIVALELIMAAACALIPAAWMPLDGTTLCFLALALFLLGCGLALVTGVLIHRFGKAAYIVVVIIASLGGGVVGGLVGFHGGTTFLMDFVMDLLNIPLLVTVGVIWYAVMAVICWLCTRKIEVRV
ncbi:MAG: hypothetical protein PUK75_10120 [bacterium]|nr:hypothetical protein [bacterium]MDY4098885.1 hypothetical protein [Lachnospiraceae bacterium]